MDVWRWSTLQETFDQLADMEPEDQRRALRLVADSDPVMADEVRELLAEDASGRDLPGIDVESLLREAFRSDDSALPLEGQIGPYRILKLLGEGGMGVVYLAERTDITGHVAIKLLRDAWLSPVRRQRFVIEQQMLGLLKHPSIARIYDAGMTKDGTPWFVMEFADGVPITDYLRGRGSTAREIVTLVGTVCEAVRYAHSLAIIHRDLKPSNILVSENGEIKLLDFGIAKQMDMVNRESTVTTAGFRLYTPAYAPPELQSQNRVGVFTDVYSIGVILYQTFTGELPFPEGVVGDRDPIRPSRLNASADASTRLALSRSEWADMDAICMKVLEKDSQNRYASMDALIADIDAFLEDRPISARENAAFYTARKFLHRNRLPVLIATLAMLLVIAGTVAFTVRLARARAAADRARDEAVLETARTARVQKFTESLFTGGASHGYPAPGIKVTQMLDRGRSEASQITGDPQLQSAMYQSLGTAYNSLGRYGDAEPLLKKALEVICTAGSSIQCADTEQSLGEAYAENGSTRDAVKLTKDALQIKLERLAGNDPLIADVMIDAGVADYLDGDEREAASLMEKALAVATSYGRPTRELAFALQQYAAYGLPYNDPRALEYAKRSAEMNLKLFGGDSFEYARSEAAIGITLYRYGRNREAEQYHRAALMHVERWSGPDEPVTVRYKLRLIEVLDQEGKTREANDLCLSALGLIKKTNPPSTLEESDAYFDLGFGEFQQGRLDAAEQHYKNVIALEQQHLPVGRSSSLYSHVGLASIAEQRGDNRRAEAILRQILADSEVRGYAMIAAHALLGRALLRQGRLAEAQSELQVPYGWFSQDKAMRPHTVQTYQDLAAIETRLGKPERARKLLAELRAHPK